MNDITFFSIPKPFQGHNAIIQRNALQSWKLLVPGNNIFLVGDEIGIDEISNEFGLVQLPKVQKTQFGTPLLSSAFAQVQQAAKTNLVCYINSDIILLSNFIKAAQAINRKEFLMVGRRWDLDIDLPLTFSNGWEDKIVEDVEGSGNLHSEFGIDYLLFPNGMVKDIPDFAVGRPGWDNWLIYHVRSRNICTIDATDEVMAIHQNHDYSHVPNAKKKNSYEGPEAVNNRRLVDDLGKMFSINDSTHIFKDSKVVVDFSNFRIMTRISHQNILIKSKLYRIIIRGLNYLYKRIIYLLTK